MSGDVYRKIGFDATQAIEELKSLKDAVNGAGRAIKRFSKLPPINIDQGLKNAKTQLDLFDKGATDAASSADNLANSANKTTKPLNNAGNALQNAGEKAKGARKSFASFIKTIRSIIAVRAIIGVFSALTGSFRQAGEAARDFQLSIAEIQTIGQSLGRTSKELTDQILGLSSALGTDAIETARGLYQVLSNQVVEASQAFGFLEEAQKLGIITVASTADAVDALSSVMNSYGLESADATRIADTLFESVNVGRFKLEDIANVIGRVTPLTAELGITWEETAAAIATMTQAGVRADTAITQLRAITTKLIKPTTTMLEAYKRWGVEDGPAAIKTFGGLAGVLRKIQIETGGSSQEMAKYFNNVRGLAGVLGLAVDEGQKFAGVIDTIGTSAGRAGEQFKVFQATDVQQLVIETEKFNNALIVMGTALIPVKTFLAAFGNEFISGLGAIFNNILKAKDVSGSIDLALSKGLEDALAKSAKARVAFTALDSKEYKKQVSNARQAAALISKEWARIYNSAATNAKTATNIFKSFSKGIADSFKKELKGVDKFLDDLNGKIKDSKGELKDDQQAIDDAVFDQDLDNTRDEAGKQKKLLDRAYKAYSDLRVKIGKGVLTEETKNELRASADRAAGFARDAKAIGAFAGYDKKADELQIDALKAKKEITEKFIKSQQDLKVPAEALQKKLGDSFTKATDLAKKQGEIAEKLGEARFKGPPGREEAESLFKDLQEVNNELKSLKISAEDVDILKRLNPDSQASDLNERIQKGLDNATYDWITAIDALRDQLGKAKLKFDARPDVKDALGATTDVGQDFEGRAKELGVELDPNQSNITKVGAVFDAAEKTTKKYKTSIENLAEATRNLQSKTNDAVGSVSKLGLANKEFSDRQQARKGRVPGSLGTFGGFGGNKDVVTQSVKNTILKTKPLMDELRKALSPDNLVTEGQAAGLRQQFENIQETTKLDPQYNQAIDKAVTSVEELAKAQTKLKGTSKVIADESAAANAAVDTLSPLDPINEGLNELKVKAQETLFKIPEGALMITNEFVKSKKAATETGNAAAQIGPNAAAAVPGINQATSAMNLLRDAGLEAAQATSLATSGGGGDAAATAKYGQYFAKGGLGKLRSIGTDTIPAMIQRGEFVTNAKSSRKFFSELNAINQDKPPVRRREGGTVTNVGDVNVSVQGGDTSRQTVRAIAVELNRELKRGTIRLGTLRKA